MKKRNFVWLFWALMFTGALVVLSQRGYSDGDDAYFYQYTHEMDLFSYLSWRYDTWVGRLAAEAMVYLTFHLGLWFWRIVNALMLVLLPIGLKRLAGKVAGISAKDMNQDVAASVTSVMGYFLMGAMTLGYAAIWINGSIFYTWTFTCGIWAMMPLADLVFRRETEWWKFLYSVPCAVIASMSIEQMGAVLLTLQVLGIAYCEIKYRKVNPALVVQTLLTIAAFVILFIAPGNDIRVATEIDTWLPQYEEMNFGTHLFITVQWLLSSFANENKMFLCGIWLICTIILVQRNGKTGKEKRWIILAAVFVLVSLLPLVGVTAFSDMGMNISDVTVRIERVPMASDLTAINSIALLWWMAALIFTFVLLWKVTRRNITMLLVYLAGIASEAIMFFSPTMYASGARVFYLTDLLYLFIMLTLIFKMEENRRKLAYALVIALGLLNFFYQIPLFLAQI